MDDPEFPLIRIQASMMVVILEKETAPEAAGSSPVLYRPVSRHCSKDAVAKAGIDDITGF